MSYQQTNVGEDSIRTTIDKILEEAMRVNASDIHLVPQQNQIFIYFRVDGSLQTAGSERLALLTQFISRIKVLANLDITETRLPQDGRFHIEHLGRQLDVRVSTYPTLYGECAVLRLLDLARAVIGFQELGLAGKQRERLETIVKRPHGLLLVTGPTGSGKTTTLFSILNYLTNPEKAIVTLEDPIEYHLTHIRQTQINLDIGITFARGLRGLFRQDADIIMVGEIRDAETASTVVEAALTGHLVLSTLHTNNAVGAIVRLLQMGIEPFLLASALTGVVAQRLVRIVCSSCRSPFAPPQRLMETLNIANTKVSFIRGEGCDACRQTGYQGRTGIFEIIEITNEIELMITNRTAPETIERRVRELGMLSLRHHGLEKAKEGITTLEEVLQLTKEE